MTRNATILSCGAYAPERIVTNQYFDSLLGEEVDTWLRENVHIYERRWCAPDESTADLVEHAARQALERAGVSATALDLIIVATDTPEYVSPSTAAVTQHRLGAARAGTFDINTACAGFVTALDIAAKYIRSDPYYQHVLVVGAYAMSKYLDLTDKRTATLFADGAGAVMLTATAEPGRGYLASELLSRGEFHDWMGIYAGGTRQPIDQAALVQRDHRLQFVRKIPTEINPDTWTRMIHTLCERTDISPQEVDHYLLTQININSIWETLDRLEVDRNRAHTIMHHYGYTGSACIPMAYNDAWEKGLIEPGQVVFFIGSGGGLSFASAAFRV